MGQSAPRSPAAKTERQGLGSERRVIRSPVSEPSPLKLDWLPEGNNSKLASLCQVRFNTWAGDDNVSIRCRVCADSLVSQSIRPGNAAVRQALGDLNDSGLPKSGSEWLHEAVCFGPGPWANGRLLRRLGTMSMYSLIRARAGGLIEVQPFEAGCVNSDIPMWCPTPMSRAVRQFPITNEVPLRCGSSPRE